MKHKPPSKFQVLFTFIFLLTPPLAVIIFFALVATGGDWKIPSYILAGIFLAWLWVWRWIHSKRFKTQITVFAMRYLNALEEEILSECCGAKPNRKLSDGKKYVFFIDNTNEDDVKALITKIKQLDFVYSAIHLMPKDIGEKP